MFNTTELLLECLRRKPNDLVSPREKPSLWTSQTFSDPYQACSAAICSSVFTWWTQRTRRKMTPQRGQDTYYYVTGALIVTLGLGSETTRISGMIQHMLRGYEGKARQDDGCVKGVQHHAVDDNHGLTEHCCSFKVVCLCACLCVTLQNRQMSK